MPSRPWRELLVFLILNEPRTLLKLTSSYVLCVQHSSHFFIVIALNWHISSVQSLNHLWLFVNPWTAAHHASLSITNCPCLPKPMSIELVILSNHLILCHPLLLPSIFPNIRVFSNESALHIRWPKHSASTSVLPMNTQDWSPLGWTSLIYLQSKGLSRVFSKTAVQKCQFFSTQLSL